MTSKDRVEKLFETLQISKQFDIIVKNTSDMVCDKYSAEFDGSGIDSNRLSKIVTEPIGLLKDRLLELGEQIYTEFFTDEEVDELVAIYSSQVFHRLLELTPEIHKRIMTFATDHVDEIQDQIEEKLEALLTDKRL